MKRFILAVLFALIPSLAFAYPDWGTFPDGGTLYFYTNTVGTDGVAETPASEAIAVYVDNSDTQLTTGVSIDDDVDSTVGLHRITIDTTQTGFVVGSTYTITYTAGTVDSVSITGRVIGSFKLGVVPANVTQWLGTAAATPTVAGVPEVDVTHANGGAISTTGSVDANVTKVGGTDIPTSRVAGVLETHRYDVGRVYYIDDTDGAGDLGTFDAPYDSWTQLTGAVTLKAGDTVHFRAGSYSGAMTNSASDIVIEGDGLASTTLTHTATTFTQSGSNCTIRGLKVAATGASGTGLVFSSNTVGNTVEYCEFDTVFDGVFASGKSCTIRHCTFGSISRTNVYDQIAISNGATLIEDCYFWTDGGSDGVDTGCIYVAAGNAATIRRCKFIIFSTETVTSGRAMLGLRTESAGVTLEDSDFTINYQSASNTGTVAAIGRASYGASDKLCVGLKNVTFNIVANGGGGLTPKQVDANTTGSVVAYSGGNLDLAQCLGTANIYANDGPLRPATNGRTAIVDAAGLVDSTAVKVGPTGAGTAQTAGDIIGDTNDVQTRLPAALTADGNMKSDTLRVGGTLQTAGNLATLVSGVPAALLATDNSGDTVGEQLERLDAEVSSAGGGDTPAQVHNQTPVPARTAKLGTRADGVTIAFPTLRIRPGEKTQVWVDCSSFTNVNLASVSNGLSSEADVDLDSVGVYGKYVSIMLDGTDADDGDTATITCDVTPAGSQVLKVKLSIVVEAE